jgi:hypothetical protein
MQVTVDVHQIMHDSSLGVKSESCRDLTIFLGKM